MVQENPRIPMPTLGIDLDGTITDAPDFFTMLCNRWPGGIIIVTYRQDVESAKRDLDTYAIRYDEIVLVKSLEDKARVIEERGIAIYFDDQDECLKDIPDTVSVFKIRNGGNFHEETRRWLYSEETGQLV